MFSKRPTLALLSAVATTIAAALLTDAMLASASTPVPASPPAQITPAAVALPASSQAEIVEAWLEIASLATIPPPAPPAPRPGADRWDRLAQCESGGNWAHPPIPGGFSGGLMFWDGTWRANGGEEFAPSAERASREQQIIVAERVLARSGWQAWPGCSRRFGWIA